MFCPLTDFPGSKVLPVMTATCPYCSVIYFEVIHGIKYLFFPTMSASFMKILHQSVGLALIYTASFR